MQSDFDNEIFRYSMVDLSGLVQLDEESAEGGVSRKPLYIFCEHLMKIIRKSYHSHHEGVLFRLKTSDSFYLTNWEGGRTIERFSCDIK